MSLAWSSGGSVAPTIFGSDRSTNGKPAAERYTQIEISLKCRDLKKMDWMSNTDAFCVVHITEPSANSDSNTSRERHISKVPSGRSVELGRTEVVHDTRNPNFSTTFKTNFIFEEQQTLLVRIYDEDKKGVSDLRKHAFVGSATLTLSELMGARGNTMKIKLEKKGFLIVHGEEVTTCNDELILQLAGSKLKNREGMFGKSDPFFTISRMHENGEFVQIHKSEYIKNNLFPEWTPVTLPVQKVCNGDIDRPIKIQIFDYEKLGKHRDMGSIETTVRNLTEIDSFDVRFEGAPYGSLLVRQAQIISVPTLLDYVSGQCEIHFIAAIDFSASNGNPTTREGLHFLDHRGFPNEYQAATATIGGILQDYGAGRKCNLFGFGMKEPMEMKPVHVFPIGDPCGVDGVQGLMDAYRYHLGSTDYVMSEPTLFAPVIKCAASYATERAQSNEQAYTVLLLLTDGGMNDMQQTIEEICNAADTPLSIVIVGVGDGDFGKMEELDSDDKKLVTFSGKTCWRDIVQFVPFRKFSSCAPRLASETLAEIPDQLVRYFLSRGITPAPRDGASLSEDDIDFTPSAVEVHFSDRPEASAASASALSLDTYDVTLETQPPHSVTHSEQFAVATLVTQPPMPSVVTTTIDTSSHFSGELSRNGKRL